MEAICFFNTKLHSVTSCNVPNRNCARSLSESESELLYDWRFTANQFVLATSPLSLTTSNFIFQLNTCSYSPYVTFPLTKGWICRLHLLLVLASAATLRLESRGSHDHVLLSQIRDPPKLESQVPVFMSPQEYGGPVTPPGTGFPFCRLIWLAGLRWRYSTPPSHGTGCRREERQRTDEGAGPPSGHSF
jgi:hypothetical protein